MASRRPLRARRTHGDFVTHNRCRHRRQRTERRVGPPASHRPPPEVRAARARGCLRPHRYRRIRQWPSECFVGPPASRSPPPEARATLARDAATGVRRPPPEARATLARGAILPKPLPAQAPAAVWAPRRAAGVSTCRSEVGPTRLSPPATATDARVSGSLSTASAAGVAPPAPEARATLARGAAPCVRRPPPEARATLARGAIRPKPLPAQAPAAVWAPRRAAELGPPIDILSPKVRRTPLPAPTPKAVGGKRNPVIRCRCSVEPGTRLARPAHPLRSACARRPGTRTMTQYINRRFVTCRCHGTHKLRAYDVSNTNQFEGPVTPPGPFTLWRPRPCP